eukprot:scpid102915/ scgid7652/ 
MQRYKGILHPRRITCLKLEILQTPTSLRRTRRSRFCGISPSGAIASLSSDGLILFSVVVDGPAKKALIIDIAVPGDPRVAEEEVKKRAKYQLLAREIHRLWQVETQIVPVVVGTLGTVSTIGVTSYCSVSELQKNALLGSEAILRKVLDL